MEGMGGDCSLPKNMRGYGPAGNPDFNVYLGIHSDVCPLQSYRDKVANVYQ